MSMLDPVISQLVNKLPNKSTDEILSIMKQQPEAGQLFGMMKIIGITEQDLKKMIDAETGKRKRAQ